MIYAIYTPFPTGTFLPPRASFLVLSLSRLLCVTSLYHYVLCENYAFLTSDSLYFSPIAFVPTKVVELLLHPYYTLYFLACITSNYFSSCITVYIKPLCGERVKSEVASSPLFPRATARA